MSATPEPSAPRVILSSTRARRALGRLRDLSVNFALDTQPQPGDAHGWKVDSYRFSLPFEPPGPPLPDGPWEIARRVLRDYEFADPHIIRAVYYPESPLAGRDMLLVGRFFGLRFHLGVRVGGVIDETRLVDGRAVRVWGWDYKTLQGHLEAGQMDYEVWKWLDTGHVDFRMHRFFRTAAIPNPVVRLGWKVFGRWMQRKFIRRAAARMDGFVRYELGLADRPPPRAGHRISLTRRRGH